MKQFFVVLSLFFFISSCDTKSTKRIVSESSGNINEITLVVDNNLWKGSVGDSIRYTLASPVDGLPQDEPLFSMSQMPPEIFTGFARKNRTVLNNCHS